MILVDGAIWRPPAGSPVAARATRWAHLASDRSYEELHQFAARLGLRRAWFQGDHYDIPSDLRERALQLGALPVTSRELVRRLRAGGLRRRG